MQRHNRHPFCGLQGPEDGADAKPGPLPAGHPEAPPRADERDRQVTDPGARPHAAGGDGGPQQCRGVRQEEEGEILDPPVDPQPQPQPQ